MSFFQGMKLLKDDKVGIVIEVLNGVAIVLWEDHKVEEWFCNLEIDLLNE